MVSRTDTFGQALSRAMTEHGQLCLGIDPHPYLLEQWGLTPDAHGAETFSLTVLDAVADGPDGVSVACVKPQVAFYEQYGSEGFAVLERVLSEARDAGILTIADAKRGDIGSTMAGYATAWLAEGSALAADAVTLSPYLGFESLRPALDVAAENGRGIFVLGLTSNPEGVEVQQRSDVHGESVAKVIVDHVARENSRELQGLSDEGNDSAPSPNFNPLGSLGIVIGATIARKARDLGIDFRASSAPLLAPGFGAQGASATDLRDGFRDAWPQVLVNSSRAILQRGPHLKDIRDGVTETLDALAAVQDTSLE